MADVAQTLKSVLSAHGVSAYEDAVYLPAENTPDTYVIFRKISVEEFISTTGVRILLTKTRFQITHVANSRSARATLVQTVKDALLGNTTDFNGVQPTNIHIEDSEAKDIFTTVKDYFIWFKE